MKGFIYKITNKVNGKSYIGQTRYTVEFRWKQHQHKVDNTYFHNAINKYGADNFTVETLEECKYEDLDSREIFYIAKYDTFNNGYNLTIGGDGRRKIVSDNQYEEIEGLYLSGFSSNKIATLYKVDKATIIKILKSMKVKLRNNKLNINNQEFKELVNDYNTGYSLRELSKRYNCSPSGLKDFLRRKGVDLKARYNILDNPDDQKLLIDDYVEGILKVSEIEAKYHCSKATIKKILSIHGINQKGKGGKFKMTESECLEAIRMFNTGSNVKDIARKFEVDKCTVYSMFRRYHVNYLTV